MKKLGVRNPAADSRGRETAIANSLFPAAPVTNWDLAPSPAVLNIFQAFDKVQNTQELTCTTSEFAPAELSRAIKRLAPSKATELSGIPNEVLKAPTSTQLRDVLRILNDCLGALTFPPRWKRARLVHAPQRPGRTPLTPRSAIGLSV